MVIAVCKPRVVGPFELTLANRADGRFPRWTRRDRKLDCSMSRHWQERFDSGTHEDLMHGLWPLTVHPPKDRLIEQWVYFVRVAGFTFQFLSVEEMRECLQFFETKIHPSGRPKPNPSWVHWYHPWYERIPGWLVEEPKRLKVVKAVTRALAEFEGDETARQADQPDSGGQQNSN